jgi:GxxExxY protein
MADLLYKDEVYAIIGAAMEVYNQLGPGFLEAIYQEALEIELSDREIPYVTQPELIVHYKEHQLTKHYVADFLVFDKIIVEIKAQNQLTSHHESQILNQLKATDKQLGLLINFGSPSNLEWKRMIMTNRSSVAHLDTGRWSRKNRKIRED